MKANSWVLVLVALAVSSCGHGPSERKAPCKHPAVLAAFSGNETEMCGPIIKIDQDHHAVVEALSHLIDAQEG